MVRALEDLTHQSHIPNGYLPELLWPSPCGWIKGKIKFSGNKSTRDNIRLYSIQAFSQEMQETKTCLIKNP
jgi:hypothetical protein